MSPTPSARVRFEATVPAPAPGLGGPGHGPGGHGPRVDGPRPAPGRRVLAVALALAVLAACPGCFFSRAKRHAPIDAEKLAEIEVGVSTIDDVVELLGAPTDILFSSREHDPLRVFALEYAYEVTKSTGFTVIVLTFLNSDAKRDHVLVFFDDAGLVSAVGSTLAADRARYGLPFSSD